MAPPEAPPRRWTTGSLPAYRHVPGLTPHPVKSPKGHSFGGIQVDLGDRVHELPESWRACEAYLLGVDLFNQGYYWESHEAWEEIWNAVGHGTLPGRMLQGMIQVAAAVLKHHMGSEGGARGNFSKASTNFDWVAAELESRGATDPTCMGVALASWRDVVSGFLTGVSDLPPYLELDADGPGKEPGHD